jgi:hypothetical protein
MTAFMSSLDKSGEFENRSLVLLAACCAGVPDSSNLRRCGK